MKKNSFKEYSNKHIHFYDLTIPELLEELISIKNEEKSFDIVDLGCGDGNLIFNLKNKGLLNKADRIVGVDLSPKRIEILKNNIKKVEGIISDACNVSELKEKSFDIVISSQIIEHLNDDTLLIKEIHRLLKKDGIAFISSIIKKPYAFYIYRIKGEFRLDPTHVREYSSKEEFIEIIENNNLKVIKIKLKKIKYPLFELIFRLLISKNLLKTDSVRSLYMNNKLFRKLRFLSLPIIGYYSIELLCIKK
jgi:2-polyprenyl-3-methyl-5-hydroxy-6-metoxy-1,4-benzoquinol methylase